MEGARGVDDERRPGAMAEGGRQGHRSDRLPFPAAPQPARRLTTRAAAPTRSEPVALRQADPWLARQRRTEIDPNRSFTHVRTRSFVILITGTTEQKDHCMSRTPGGHHLRRGGYYLAA